MPDIDSLQISITSSTQGATTSINSLIRKLGELNIALNNYTGDSQYIKGFNGLVTGLTGISNAVKFIDIEKLKNLSTTLGSLATSGTKLSKLNFVQSFSQLGSEAQKTSTAIENTTRSWLKNFDIPERRIGKFKMHIRSLYETANDPKAFADASDGMWDFIKSCIKAQDETRELTKEWLKTSKLNLTSGFYGNFGKDVGNSLRGIIGISNTGIGNGDDFLTAMKEMKDHIGTPIELSQGYAVAARSLADFLDKKNDLARTYAEQESLTILSGLTTELYDSLNKATQAEQAFGQGGSQINNVTNALSQMETKLSGENPFQGLVTGLESLKNIEIPAEKFAGVTNLAATLSKFGGKNAQNAITVIPQIGRSFAQMAAELAKAPAISQNLVRLAEALSQFSRSAKTASTSSTGFGKSTNFLSTALRNVHIPTMRAHRGFTSLAAIFGRLYANFFLLIRGAKALGRAMDYSSSMTEAQNVVSVVFGKSADVMDDFAQTAIKDFGLARLSAVQFASRFQAMGSTMGLTAEQIGKANDFIADKVKGNSRAYKDLGDSVANMSINLTKLTADIASLYNQDYADVAQDMQAIYTGMTRPLRKYGLDLTQATLKEWAMANGLEADIEKMSQAEKTMLRYQYVMSRAAGAMGDFQKTQDTWANSLRTVKQLMQEVARTIGEALINALRPALLAFKNFLFNFLKLTESALNALGKLLGWKQIDFGGAALVEDTEDYADALDDAAGAAKKLKGQLRGIDELNNLTTNKGSGGGAGGLSGAGAGIESIWDMIKDSERDYESEVKDWYDFGRRISNAFKSGLETINWQEVFEKATGFGTNLASFLNGLIDPETWKLFGKTLGNGIMTAFKFAFAFSEEFEWENLGEAIAEGINGLFEALDGGEMADALDSLIQGIQKTLKTAVEKIDWEQIKQVFKDFFANIDIETIDFLFGAGVLATAAATITGAIASIISTSGLSIGLIGISIGGAYLIGKHIGDLWEEALGKDEITGESYWYEFWEKIFKAGGVVWTALDKVIGKDTAIGSTAGAITDVLWFGLKGTDNIETWLGKYFEIGEFFKGVKEDIKENLGPVLEEAGKEIKEWWDDFMPDIDTDSTAFKIFEFNWDSIFKPFQLEEFDTAPIDTLIDKVTLLAAKFGSFIADADLTNITTKLAEVLSGVAAFGDPTNQTGITNLGASFLNLRDTENESGSALDLLTGKFEEFKTNTAEILQNWWDDDVAPKFDLPTWEEMVSSIKDSIESVWNDTVDFWTRAVPEWFEQDVKPFFTKDYWVGFLTGIKDAFSQIWGDAKELAKGFFNSIADFAENFINGAIDGFSALASAKSILSEVNINFNVPHIKIPRFAQGGYPSTGSLFWAGEAGAEMIGSMNGKTTVASNGEITGIISAIQQTSSAEMELLRQQNSLLQGILEKEFGISNDDLFRSVRNSARDFTNRTGNPAF